MAQKLNQLDSQTYLCYDLSPEVRIKDYSYIK